MKTKKQRDQQRARRIRKRAERWERDIANPRFVTLMLLADHRNRLYLEHRAMKHASVVIRYHNRGSIMRAMQCEITVYTGHV